MVAFNGAGDADVALGIICFEAAAAMAKLVAIHRTLSDSEISRLRSDTMRAAGVAYLTSPDQPFLLRLAAAELLTDLDVAAAAASRFAARAPGCQLERIYSEFKSGSLLRSGIDPNRYNIRPRVKKMEKLVVDTAKLFAEMEALDELEAAARRYESRCNRNSGPIPRRRPVETRAPAEQCLQLELKSRRQKVQRLKDESLWSRSFEKVAALMVGSACAAFARICAIFGPLVPGLSSDPLMIIHGKKKRIHFIKLPIKGRFEQPRHSSGPVERRILVQSAGAPLSISCPILGRDRSSEAMSVGDWKKILAAPVDTVGGAGLASRYASVIVSAERLLRMEAEGRGEEATTEREELYEMLPSGLRAAVRAKLQDWWRNRGPLDADLAQGWKEAADRIMVWLAPVAHDTVRWHSERTMDRERRFDMSARAFLLQTLHFSNKAKVEVAIAEVLVGLSCMCWYERRLDDD